MSSREHSRVRLECSARDHLAMVVKMGKCRSEDCGMFGKWGPAGSFCPSTHHYLTRSTHIFEKPICDDEANEANFIDFQDHIGVCPIVTCLEVGYPGMTCYRCMNLGVYNTFSKPEDRFNLDFFVPIFYPETKLRNLSALKKVKFIPVEIFIPNEDSSDDGSLRHIRERYVVSPARSDSIRSTD